MKLPKNVKQIGSDNSGRKIYIEDYVYSFIRDIRVDDDDDGAVGLLLGETIKEGSNTYVFIKGCVEVTNAAVFTDRIAFTEETWPVADNTVKSYFPQMDIVGWYLCSSKITDKNMFMIDKADTENFKSPDQVFYMVNNETREERFYEKTEAGLKALNGYIIFYERNDAMQTYMADFRARNNIEDRDTANAIGKYRQIMNNKKAPVDKSVKRHLTFIYGLSMLLIIVVLIIGVNSINNYDSMKNLGNSVSSIADNQQVNADPQTTDTTPVTNQNSDVTTEPPTTEEPTTEAPTTEAPTTAAPTTAAEDSYQTYTVQDGDTFSGICKKFYGSDKMTDIQIIMDYNGIASPNDLLPGATIKIPNK